GQHNEQFWRSQFRAAFLWLFPETSGISQKRADELNLRIYPNPAGDVLHIVFKDIPDQPCLSLFNISGACIRPSSVFSGTHLDISRLPAGWYLIRLSANGKTATRQFFKL
ncbi:MAG: T9SS type A sorting domain-containing protein, partial [Bacteroidales bacterium]